MTRRPFRNRALRVAAIHLDIKNLREDGQSRKGHMLPFLLLEQDDVFLFEGVWYYCTGEGKGVTPDGDEINCTATDMVFTYKDIPRVSRPDGAPAPLEAKKIEMALYERKTVEGARNRVANTGKVLSELRTAVAGLLPEPEVNEDPGYTQWCSRIAELLSSITEQIYTAEQVNVTAYKILSRLLDSAKRLGDTAQTCTAQAMDDGVADGEEALAQVAGWVVQAQACVQSAQEAYRRVCTEEHEGLDDYIDVGIILHDQIGVGVAQALKTLSRLVATIEQLRRIL